jgi:hypothetical protein
LLGIGEGGINVPRIDEANRATVFKRGAMSAAHFGLIEVTPIVYIGAHSERRQYLRSTADVIGVLVRNPDQIDGRAVEVDAEPFEEVLGGPFALVATPAPEAAAGVH